MSKQPKNGKLPSSARTLMEDLVGMGESSLFDIDPAIVAEMTKKEKTLRWINATKFKAAGGFSGKGWAPVRTTDIDKKILESSSMMFGATAEGFIVRNDMMLACRPSEMTERHERQLKAKAALAGGKTKQAADGIREKLGKYGRVTEGYDENGEE